MAIRSLEVRHFRNLKDIHIKPLPGLNYIIGPNGSGKSSLLEAIHCLGRGKSFRTHKTNRLICEGCSSFTVLGHVQQRGRQFTVGMHRERSKSTIKLAGRLIARSSELTQALPVTVLEPGLHRLIEEGPEYRRKFLDWGVFHVEHGFHHIWNTYRRVLAQRNAALRSGGARASIINWDQELVQTAVQLDQARQRYLTDLMKYVPIYSQKFPDLTAVRITYQRGWREGEAYADYLAAQYVSDKERGFTQFGPHRADLRIRIQGVDAREYLSRGQQKVLVALLVLAQCEQMRMRDTSVVVLVDDLPSELDTEKRNILMQSLTETGAQIFLTGTDRSLFPLDNSEHGMFHVEQGRVHVID
ncbi:MAG TPA: DNA replication/repair protein RecF [Gammaproteobacteria bacterium]|nr:DNA replication/repair protein RecF [Gammaproteobacteria bacterium]